MVKGVDVANSNFIGTGYGLYADNLYAKPYVSPYSIQFNGGVQHQFAPGVMLSVDYVHNATLKVTTAIDVNHDGAARTLNNAAATNAIKRRLRRATHRTSMRPSLLARIKRITTQVPKRMPAPRFQTLHRTVSTAALSCLAGSGFGVWGDAVTGAAFPGTNPNVGDGLFLLPVGRSGYDALQAVFQEQKQHPLPGLNTSDLQISYSLSRSVTNSNGSGSATSGSSDEFFASSRAFDNDDPNRYIGRSNLDHTNELSFGGTIGIKGGLQLGPSATSTPRHPLR